MGSWEEERVDRRIGGCGLESTVLVKASRGGRVGAGDYVPVGRCSVLLVEGWFVAGRSRSRGRQAAGGRRRGEATGGGDGRALGVEARSAMERPGWDADASTDRPGRGGSGRGRREGCRESRACAPDHAAIPARLQPTEPPGDGGARSWFHLDTVLANPIRVGLPTTNCPSSLDGHLCPVPVKWKPVIIQAP